jgi:glutamine amidotransferase
LAWCSFRPGKNPEVKTLCELLAVSSRLPTNVGLALEKLARRGGLEGPQREGWGVAFYDNSDALILKEPGAAANSELARYIEHHTPPSELVVSHIRHATHGDIVLSNTHPFSRELGGRVHIFAHNGELTFPEQLFPHSPRRFSPIGDTDSELAFCRLMSELVEVWDSAGGRIPSVSARIEVITDFAAAMRRLGPANFLYSDSDILVAHGHKRVQPDGQIKPPGLHVLEHTCHQPDTALSSSGITVQNVSDETTMVATVPLTEGDWRPLDEGEILIIKSGKVII